MMLNRVPCEFWKKRRKTGDINGQNTPNIPCKTITILDTMFMGNTRKSIVLPYKFYGLILTSFCDIISFLLGKVAWSRQLFRRIQEPMEAFQVHPLIMSSVDGRKVIKNYNKLAKTLLEFEVLYHRGWLRQVRISFYC